MRNHPSLRFVLQRLAPITAAGCLAILVAGLAGCGETYRPIALPVVPPGGDPQITRVAAVVNNNNGGPGTTTQIDATGDTNIGNFQVGSDPVNAAFLGGTTRVYVANRSADSVSFYSPTVQGSPVSTVGLPAGARPVYIAVAGTNAYVAESGTNKVGLISAAGLLSQELPVGVDPVAIATTPDNQWAYVANKGSGTVSIISIGSGAFNLVTTLLTGNSPVWVTAKNDSSTIYVLNQGSGTITVIDTSSEKVVGTVSVGSNPRMMAFDATNHRLYVANTGSNTISVFDADPQVPTLLNTVTVGTAPTAVVPLADGSRFYVTNSGCTDTIGLTGCTGNTVSVVDARSFTIRKTVTVGSTPVWLAASPESTKVVVVNRDSNNITDIRTLDDTVVSTNPSASPQPVFVAINGA